MAIRKIKKETVIVKAKVFASFEGTKSWFTGKIKNKSYMVATNGLHLYNGFKVNDKQLVKEHPDQLYNQGDTVYVKAEVIREYEDKTLGDKLLRVAGQGTYTVDYFLARDNEIQEESLVNVTT